MITTVIEIEIRMRKLKNIILPSAKSLLMAVGICCSPVEISIKVVYAICNPTGVHIQAF